MYLSSKKFIFFNEIKENLKNLINKPYGFINLVLLTLVSSFLLSCAEIEDNQPQLQQDIISNSAEKSSQYEEKLKELTFFFGEVMKDPAAREELFSFADVHRDRGDIDYSLKKLFEEGKDPIYRKKSAIVSAFTEKANEKSRVNQDLNVDELINFIKENNISVVAPYLAEDFEPNAIEELTLSWWTQEFENEQIALDKDWKGATKAKKITLDNSLEKNDDSENNYFMVSDDWAEKHPTIVLGAFPDHQDDIDLGNSRIQTSNNSNAKMTSNPVQLCDANDKVNENIIVRMPALRLEDNIRRWPNANEMYLWVAFANDIELGSDGLPDISSDVNMPLARFPITRKEARIKRWLLSNTSFIISSWKPEADNMYLVWGCTRTSTEIDVEGGIKASKTGISGEANVEVAIRNSVELVSALSFDKCFTVANNVNATNQGYGYYGNTSFPVYAFGEVRTYFTLETL